MKSQGAMHEQERSGILNVVNWRIGFPGPMRMEGFEKFTILAGL
jgi:hypothetical protein